MKILEEQKLKLQIENLKLENDKLKCEKKKKKGKSANDKQIGHGRLLGVYKIRLLSIYLLY